MAVLTIRKLPEKVREELRLRAARAGTSMEAEARAILLEATAGDAKRQPARALQDWVDELYGGRKPGGVVEELLEERWREAREENPAS
jgi:plasmid stability protein